MSKLPVPEVVQLVPSFARTLRRLAPYIHRRRALISRSFGMLFVAALMRLAEPWPLKILFDSVIVPKLRASSVIDTAGFDPITIVVACAIGVVVVTVLRAFAEYGSTVGFVRAGNDILAEVRADLYKHLQRLSMSFHTKARGGDLMMRVMSDVNMLRDVTVTALMPMVASVLSLVGMICVMLWMDWRLALLALSTIPLFGFTATRLSSRIRSVARQQRRDEGRLAATSAESISAIRVVQSFTLEDRFAQGFDERSVRAKTGDVKLSRLSAVLERSVDVLIAISTAMVITYGGQLVMRGELSPGDLLVFFTYLKRAFNPVQDFAKYTSRLAKASAAGERVVELFDIEPEVKDMPGAIPAPDLQSSLEFDHVCFSYGGQMVLDDVSFAVKAGERIAIVGPSGIGKSTTGSLVLRLWDPQSGLVKIDGRDIRDYTLSSLRGQISTVMQDSVLFAGTIAENIAMGRLGASREDVMEAARLANADGFISRLPEGYETQVGERGVTLSGGERQRIAIARAAVRNAHILILDEPTTGLDEESARLVVDAIDRLTSGKTTLLISHDLRLASRCDRVLYLEKQTILEQGDHASLMARKGRYASLFTLQAGEFGGERGLESDAQSC